MAYVLIADGVVVQKQTVDGAGFVEAPDSVVCGMTFNGTDYVNPSITSDKAKSNKLADVDTLKLTKMASFTFGGKTYQSDHDSRDNIMGSATWASVAITGGAQVGDYRWHGGPSDFQFIAADNSKVTMDAQTVKSLGETMGLHLYNCIQNARTHKDNIELLASGSPTATVAEIENYDITTGWPA